MLMLQGRFWAKDWPELKLPESSLPKFAFSDGNPRVYVETEDADSEAVAPPGAKFDKLNWLKVGCVTDGGGTMLCCAMLCFGAICTETHAK